MFKKTYSINNCFLYDYIYDNTKEKTVLFGFFLYTQEPFCGKVYQDKIQVYCTDITLCCFNPLITAKKIDENHLSVTVKYNAVHCFIMALSLFIGIFSLFFCAAFPLNLFVIFLLIIGVITAFKINYNLQKKKIMDRLLSVKQKG